MSSSVPQVPPVLRGNLFRRVGGGKWEKQYVVLTLDHLAFYDSQTSFERQLPHAHPSFEFFHLPRGACEKEGTKKTKKFRFEVYVGDMREEFHVLDPLTRSQWIRAVDVSMRKAEKRYSRPVTDLHRLLKKAKFKLDTEKAAHYTTRSELSRVQSCSSDLGFDVALQEGEIHSLRRGNTSLNESLEFKSTQLQETKDILSRLTEQTKALMHEKELLVNDLLSERARNDATKHTNQRLYAEVRALKRGAEIRGLQDELDTVMELRKDSKSLTRAEQQHLLQQISHLNEQIIRMKDVTCHSQDEQEEEEDDDHAEERKEDEPESTPQSPPEQDVQQELHEWKEHCACLQLQNTILENSLQELLREVQRLQGQVKESSVPTSTPISPEPQPQPEPEPRPQPETNPDSVCVHVTDSHESLPPSPSFAPQEIPIPPSPPISPVASPPSSPKSMIPALLHRTPRRPKFCRDCGHTTDEGGGFRPFCVQCGYRLSSPGAVV